MTDSTSLATRVAQRLDSGKVELPVLDEVAMRVYRGSRSGQLDADAICELMKRDPVLVGDVLRTANSTFFGGLVEVRSLHHAVVRLGSRQLAALALAAGTKRLYRSSAPPFRSRMTALWRHTSAVAAGSSWLATRTGHRALADEAFVAGLMHDIGKLVLLCGFEELAASDEAAPDERQMDEAVHALHCERGARQLEEWNLPEPLPSLVRRLQDEPVDPADTLLCIVRLVDGACAREGISDEPDPDAPLEAMPENGALGVTEEIREELIDTLRSEFGASTTR